MLYSLYRVCHLSIHAGAPHLKLLQMNNILYLLSRGKGFAAAAAVVVVAAAAAVVIVFSRAVFF